MLVNDIDLPTPFAVTKLPDIPKQGTSRRKPVAHIVLHTTGGYPDSKHPTPQRLRPEAASSRHCLAAAVHAYWVKAERIGAAHLLVDADGAVCQIADLSTRAMYHCVGYNQISIGVEVVQQGDSSLFAAQLVSVVELCEWLALRFALPRSVAMPYVGVRNVTEGIGVIGHRDLSSNRGSGDPGDFVMGALVDAGWAVV
jgi:N-acetyl-anhydromuramyl-L-alanine amidase AmpD